MLLVSKGIGSAISVPPTKKNAGQQGVLLTGRDTNSAAYLLPTDRRADPTMRVPPIKKTPIRQARFTDRKDSRTLFFCDRLRSNVFKVF